MTRQYRVLIADDEPLARASVRTLLAQDGEIAVVGECEDGPSTLAALRSGGVDILFLDIQMPGMTGLDVLASIEAEALPATVLVTAFDEYAVRAFELRSLDYLLKPFSDDRFRQALRRAKDDHDQRRKGVADERILALLEDLRSSTMPGTAGTGYLDRIVIRSTGKVVLVPIAEIERIEAEGDYARIVTKDKSHLLRETVASLSERLDPALFLRIHRSYIVPIDRIRELRPQSNGDYRVHLVDGVQLPLSRTYREQVLSTLEHTRRRP